MLNKKTYAIVSNNEANQNPYPYVYIEENGVFKELSLEDKRYLEEEFYPNDGNFPYVKSKYRSKTPDGKISGFLKRSKLPKGLFEGQIPKLKKWWVIW